MIQMIHNDLHLLPELSHTDTPSATDWRNANLG
jgi:hypothetical protein